MAAANPARWRRGLGLGGLVAVMAITYLLGGDPFAVLTGGVPTETAASLGGQTAHRSTTKAANSSRRC